MSKKRIIKEILPSSENWFPLSTHKHTNTHPKRNAFFAVLTLSGLLIAGFASAATSQPSNNPTAQETSQQQLLLDSAQHVEVSPSFVGAHPKVKSDAADKITQYNVELAGNVKAKGKTTSTTSPSPTATPTATSTPKPTATATTASPTPTATATTTTATPTATTSTTVASAPVSVEHKLKFGVATNGGPLASTELDAVATVAGEAPSMILFYKDFTQAFPTAELNATDARGATPLLTWEPWVANGNTTQADYTLDNITAGKYDAYIKQWASGMKSYGKPIMLRFAHEMNGNWYPWSEGVNNNGSGDYVQAWKHVHDVVVAEGVTNVSWVWSPNAPYYGSVPLSGLYPGDNYVDIVALDGYNWGTTQSWGSAWQTPQQVFGQGISELRTIAPGKPILIAETASAEQGGSKADWNNTLVSYLSAQPDVMGFVWFNLNKEVDWRINSSTTSASAFANALDGRP